MLELVVNVVGRVYPGEYFSYFFLIETRAMHDTSEL